MDLWFCDVRESPAQIQVWPERLGCLLYIYFSKDISNGTSTQYYCTNPASKTKNPNQAPEVEIYIVQ